MHRFRASSNVFGICNLLIYDRCRNSNREQLIKTHRILLNDVNKHETLIIVFSRFRVIFEMIKPDKLDGSTTLKGLQYIDVPGQMKMDYKIDFYAHKEGTFSAKVCWTYIIDRHQKNVHARNVKAIS